jgi:LysM repeat protein
MVSMICRLLRYAGLSAVMTSAVWAQTADNTTRMELASLRQDVLLLSQRVGELTMTVEQLNRDNSSLQAKASQSFVTLEQLNRAIADLNHSMQSALAEQKRETLTQVGGQMERLAKQTQAAIDALAKNQATRPAVQTTFTEDFPKEGINYTVQSGDTLSGIAKKTGAKLQDIRNANKIGDDTKIRVGQTLFIPAGK